MRTSREQIYDDLNRSYPMVYYVLKQITQNKYLLKNTKIISIFNDYFCLALPESRAYSYGKSIYDARLLQFLVDNGIDLDWNNIYNAIMNNNIWFNSHVKTGFMRILKDKLSEDPDKTLGLMFRYKSIFSNEEIGLFCDRFPKFRNIVAEKKITKDRTSYFKKLTQDDLQDPKKRKVFLKEMVKSPSFIKYIDTNIEITKSDMEMLTANQRFKVLEFYYKYYILRGWSKARRLCGHISYLDYYHGSLSSFGSKESSHRKIDIKLTPEEIKELLLPLFIKKYKKTSIWFRTFNIAYKEDNNIPFDEEEKQMLRYRLNDYK